MAKDKIDQLTEIVKAGFANLETRMEKGFGAVAEDVEELPAELKGNILDLGEQLTKRRSNQ
jgi:hypothetical protein